MSDELHGEGYCVSASSYRQLQAERDTLLQANTAANALIAEGADEAQKMVETLTQERDQFKEDAAHKEMDAFNLSQRFETVQQERDRLRQAVELILPLAKGYANAHDVESTRRHIQLAQDALDAATGRTG